MFIHVWESYVGRFLIAPNLVTCRVGARTPAHGDPWNLVPQPGPRSTSPPQHLVHSSRAILSWATVASPRDLELSLSFRKTYLSANSKVPQRTQRARIRTRPSYCLPTGPTTLVVLARRKFVTRSTARRLAWVPGSWPLARFWDHMAWHLSTAG
jgi:hypothetical protein